MKFLVALALLTILVVYGYIVGSYLYIEKKHSLIAIIVISSPMWTTILFTIYLVLRGKA